MFHWIVVPSLTTLTSFSHFRRIMAQHPPHKVWVHFDEQGRNPTKVSVVNCNDVDDLVKAALLKLYQSVSPDLVSVTFGGEKVKTDAAVTDYVTMTSDDKPLLLHISHKKRKVDVGEYLIVHTLCSYCSCTYLGIVIVYMS